MEAVGPDTLPPDLAEKVMHVLGRVSGEAHLLHWHVKQVHESGGRVAASWVGGGCQGIAKALEGVIQAVALYAPH